MAFPECLGTAALHSTFALTVPTQYTFASHNVSVLVLYCMELNMCSLANPVTLHCTIATAMPLLVSQPFLGWLLGSWLVSFPPGFCWRSQLSNIFASSVCPACTPALHCTLHKECVLTLAWSHLVGLWDWRGFLCVAPLHGTQHCICTSVHGMGLLP